MGGLVDDLDKNRWLTAAFFGGPNDLDNGVVGNVNCISKINIFQCLSLEDILSVSKLILSFFRTFQKINLDMETEFCYNI